jgi:hypothetical protein
MNSKYLFHGTSIYALANIAHTDVLCEGVYWNKPNEPHGPRTTESFDVAKTFIEYACHWGEGGVIVLDREKLAQDFELVVYEDKTYSGDGFGQDEQEIAIITEEITDLSKYVVSFVCDPRIIEAAMHEDNIEGATSECGWCADWGDVWSEGLKDEHLTACKAAMHSLASSPLLNVSPEFNCEDTLRGEWELPPVVPTM